MPKLLYTMYITFFKNFSPSMLEAAAASFRRPLSDENYHLKQMPTAKAFVAHAPRFTTAKEKLNSSTRKRFKTRHNIYEATCAKQDKWL